ncbi:MAG TPA: hypothetical protein VG013_29240 [Gemmataceae bacterium]|jgi:hypothetical protein|nr:hypothetical protein [Gemmataceae bacterium]
MRSRLLTWLPPLLAVLPAAAYAETPRDHLLRLVPPDVGFCFVVQDLRRHSESFLASAFVKQFRASPVGVALAKDPDMQKLARADKELEKYLRVGWPRLRDDIFGDAVVFAYRPGPPGKREQEQGVMLVEARDAKLLAELVDRVNAVQKKAGDLKDVEVHKHKGAAYYRRVERKGVNFYYLHGPVLAFSRQEEMLRHVIELDRQAAAKEPPLVSRQLSRCGADRDLAVWWINPPAFVPDLEEQATQSSGAESTLHKAMLAYWKPLEGITLSAAVHRNDLELKLVLLARQKELPETVRHLFAGKAQASELWRRFPSHAILAVAGRVDGVALGELVSGFLTPEARTRLREAVDRGAGAALGKEVGKEVVPFLGPDWGFCVVAPPAVEKALVPEMLWALRVRPDGKVPPVDQALLNALNTFAMLAVFSYNSANADQISLKTAVEDKTEVKYLASNKRFAPGFQPAFALKDGYLLLAGSPGAIRRFNGASTSTGPVLPAGEIPLLRFSVRELRTFLKDRIEPLAAQLAGKQGLSKEEAQRHLRDLIRSSELVERVDVNQRAAPGLVAFMLRVHTAAPVQK